MSVYDIWSITNERLQQNKQQSEELMNNNQISSFPNTSSTIPESPTKTKNINVESNVEYTNQTFFNFFTKLFNKKN